MRVDVYLLPTLVDPEELTGKLVVVVDVLRATTTIVHALAAGATQVIPCLEVDEARQKATQLSQAALLGGERGGKPIPGFHLGNSPAEYSRQQVGGKTIVFTTTNGTRAMLRCRAANKILIGAFTNFSAVCREIADSDQIAIVCAGTDLHITREDTLFAGAVVDDLATASENRMHRPASPGPQPPPTPWTLNDQAEIAADAWRAAVRALTDRPLGMMLRASRGGRNLIEIGQESDIDVAAQIDKYDLVPKLDIVNWHIRA